MLFGQNLPNWGLLMRRVRTHKRPQHEKVERRLSGSVASIVDQHSRRQPRESRAASLPGDSGEAQSPQAGIQAIRSPSPWCNGTAARRRPYPSPTTAQTRPTSRSTASPRTAWNSPSISVESSAKQSGRSTCADAPRTLRRLCWHGRSCKLEGDGQHSI